MSLTPKITTLIPLQNFEKVSDRVAEILMTEFSNQEDLSRNDSGLLSLLRKTAIFKEHFRTFNSVKSYGILLSLMESEMSNAHPMSATNTITMYIRCDGRVAYK